MRKILLILSVLLMTGSCRTPKPVKFWAGSTEAMSIVRRQDNDAISCMDARFDEYICIHHEELDALLERCGE